MKRIRVLLAEDHFLPRFAVRTLLEREPDLEVVAEAETGWQAVELYQKERPDIVLTDLRMPEFDGFAAIAAIVRHDPRARILVLSHYESQEDVARAISAGASGYLPKDVDGRTLVEAIRSVASGLRYVPDEIARRLAEREEALPLTAREHDVLSLVAGGASNAEVGKALKISEGTARIHMTNIMAKLGVKSRTQAAAVALKRGLLERP